MSNLKEIPEDIDIFTAGEIVLMSFGAGILAVLILIWVCSLSLKREKKKSFKSFEEVDRDSLPEDFDHSTLPENISKSRFSIFDLPSEAPQLIVMMGVMAIAMTFGVLSVINAFHSNRTEVEEVVFHNISETYKTNFTADDLDFVYRYTGSSEIEKINVEYIDLDTDTLYNLTFIFKDNKGPVLLKTGNVNDELINKLTK